MQTDWKLTNGDKENSIKEEDLCIAYLSACVRVKSRRMSAIRYLLVLISSDFAPLSVFVFVSMLECECRGFVCAKYLYDSKTEHAQWPDDKTLILRKRTLLHLFTDSSLDFVCCNNKSLKMRACVSVGECVSKMCGCMCTSHAFALLFRVC